MDTVEELNKSSFQYLRQNISLLTYFFVAMICPSMIEFKQVFLELILNLQFKR